MKDSSTQKWRTVTLGTICEFRRGLTYKKSDEVDSEGTPVLRANNVDLATGELKLDEVRYIDPRIEVPISKKVVAGSLLICTASGSKKHLGKTALIEDQMDLAFGGFMGLLIPHPTILPKYLQWRLRSDAYWSFIDGLSDGANINNLKFKQLSEFPVPLPPLEEQQRIVAVLDEAFEGLARARAHAEANLKSAQELFGSFAKSVFQPHEASKNDPGSTTLGAVCDIQSGAGFPLKYQGLTNGEHPFYKVSDMNLPGNEWELREANHYISEDVRLELRARLFPEGSIVFPKVGGAIATNKKRIIRLAGCVDNNVMGLIPDKFKVVPEYIHEWLHAFDIYEFSNKANPPSITQATVSSWPLRVPSRDEQLKIVATAAALREQTESLRERYEARLKDFDDLRQSLLQKAFAGELT